MRHAAHADSYGKSTTWYVVSVWGFLVLAVISGAFTVRALVHNSAEAKRRYETLLAVDASGGDVEKALYDLRSYIYGHMNTTIGSPTGVKPPIQLKGTYDRLVAAEKARVATAKQSNANLYNKAQQECERLIPSGLSGRSRIPCITEYVTTRAQPETEQAIPDGLYKFDFVSPRWSPDAAGFGIIVTALLLLVFLFRFLVYWRAKLYFRSAQ